MAAEDPAVRRTGFGGAIGVQGQGPAEPVHAHLMVEGTQEQQVFEPGPAAAGAVDQVVDVAACWGLVAAAGLLIVQTRNAAEIVCA
jgi:hypothetical protein